MFLSIILEGIATTALIILLAALISILYDGYKQIIKEK